MNRKSGAVVHRYAIVASILVLVLASLLPVKTALSQGAPPVSYTFDECDQVSEAGLRDELNRITQAVFDDGRQVIPVKDIVEQHWRELGMDNVIDQEVEHAIERVRNDTPFWEIIWSGWSIEAAEKLAARVTFEAFLEEDTPRETPFEEHFGKLSTQVATDIVGEIRLVTAESASSALVCVQEFIGDKFSSTMTGVLDIQIQEELEVLKDSPDTDVNFVDILKAHSALAGGIAVVISTRIGTQIAKRIATVVGKNIVSRIVSKALVGAITAGLPVLGWIIGGFLLVKDVYDSRDGALPLIRDSLTSEDVKAQLRERTAEAIVEELRKESPELARSIANSTFSKWQDFRQKFSRILDLAENLPRFKSILDRTEIDQVAKLADLVHLVEEREPDQLEELVQTGRLELLLTLPEEALEILRVTGSSETLLSWAELAEDLILRVVETELYLVASPTDLKDRMELEKVLALGEIELIQKLMLLNESERNALLGLPTTHTQELLNAFASEELSWLVTSYLTTLSERNRNILIDRLLGQPELMAELSTETVMTALFDAQDFSQALNYVLQNTGDNTTVGQLLGILTRSEPVISGELPWSLFWHYERAALGSLGWALAGLIVLYVLLKLLFFRRQRQDVNVNVVLPERNGEPSNDTGQRGKGDQGSSEGGT